MDQTCHLVKFWSGSAWNTTECTTASRPMRQTSSTEVRGGILGSEPCQLAVRVSAQYVVVARRYRPQDFSQLIGQEQVSQALANAITTNRVGHAYLFTGARGVGKTSTARILAKALNCVNGPTTTPCDECDICQGIASRQRRRRASRSTAPATAASTKFASCAERQRPPQPGPIQDLHHRRSPHAHEARRSTRC